MGRVFVSLLSTKNSSLYQKLFSLPKTLLSTKSLPGEQSFSAAELYCSRALDTVTL
jgi:hypothetical protein